MPNVAWYDSTLGRTIPIGQEDRWAVPPVGMTMLRRMARNIQRERTGIHISDLLSTPRQVLIDRYLPNNVAPESHAVMELGVIMHDALQQEAEQLGYTIEAPLMLKMPFGDVICSPDAIWVEKDKPPHFPDILEFKFTNSGSMKFLVEDDRAKEDHVAQGSAYANAAVDEGLFKTPQELITVIEYYAMPAKERFKIIGYQRTPVYKPFLVSPMTKEEIAAYRGGWTPPTKEGQPAEPPGSVEENYEVLAPAIAAIEGGADPKQVIAGVPCVCDRRFNGQGRTYCGSAMTCAMEDHGTTVW